MNFNEYQNLTSDTAVYPTEYCQLNSQLNVGILYCALKLAGESGEVTEKIGKILRDKQGVFSTEDKTALKKEIGDVLWYCAQLSKNLGFSLDEVADANIEKLFSRKERGVLQGSGDNR